MSETLQASVDMETLWYNFVAAKELWQEEVPLDSIQFVCCDCGQNINMMNKGMFMLNEKLDQKLSEYFGLLQAFLLEEHISSSDTCSGKVKFGSLGPPQYMVFLMPPTNSENLDDILILEDQQYTKRISIQDSEAPNQSIFALYEKAPRTDEAYYSFIMDNFKNFLNINHDLEDNIDQVPIHDDDTVNQYRDLLPRMSGGGRKKGQTYNYRYFLLIACL